MKSKTSASGQTSAASSSGQTSAASSSRQTPAASSSRQKSAASQKILDLRSELVLASVLLAIVGALIVTPRPTYPSVVPLPEIDTAEARTLEQNERARAQKVKDGSLPKSVRLVGELFRRASYAGTHQNREARDFVQQLRKQVRLLLDSGGEESLLDLRALQAELFVEAAAAWSRQDPTAPSRKQLETELDELGGDFRKVAEGSFRRNEGGLVLDSDELRLLFRIHWGRVTGVFLQEPFGPTLSEVKRYHLLFLLHPKGHPENVFEQAQNQVKHAEALGKVDVRYPAKLAEGILRLRLGQSERALALLRAHLSASPNGPWTQIARNHLRLAESQAAAEAGLTP